MTPAEFESRLATHANDFFYTQRPDSLFTVFTRLAKQFPDIATLVDVGASNGSWSGQCMEFFPTQQYLLIEAQPTHAAELREFVDAHPRAQVCMAAAGATRGRIQFHTADPLGGLAHSEAFSDHNIEVPMTTIDDEVRERGLRGPFFLKFDVHGYEVPILEGAAAALGDTELIVMECYNFKIAAECLLFHEMCAYLDDRGFRPLAFVEVLNRPDDGVLWQVDIVFAKKSAHVFQNGAYR